MSKVPQRYGRDYFTRILKAEILLEQKVGNARLMEGTRQARKSAG